MSVYDIGTARPDIAEDAYVAPGAVIVGNVVIRSASSVWFHAVIRGDADQITIDTETNIQDLSMLHADPGMPLSIGKRVTVGHRCVIHGCTVEDDCLVGMGAVIMNGAVIGQGSIIAAGAVILENTVIPPFSLVAGMPGKVKRTHGQEMIGGIRASAEHYTVRSREYALHLHSR